MSAKTILYATDYSTGSDLVLELAAVLARQHEATLLLVHVAEAEEYPVGERFDVQPAANPAALRRLQEVVPPDPDVPFRHQLLYGPPGSAEVTKPADEIVKLANQEKVDMIVLGTHGRTGLKYLLVGSVAEAVLRRASCPVVTVMLPRVSAATGQLRVRLWKQGPSRC